MKTKQNRRDFLQKVGIGFGALLTSDMLFADNIGDKMYLAMEFNNTKAIIELVNNPTTREFVAMLPLELEWSDFAQKEKITYLPKRLQARGDIGYEPRVGDFFCYVPWGNVGIFYEKQAASKDLAYLGRLTQGLESLRIQKGNFNVKMYMLEIS